MYLLDTNACIGYLKGRAVGVKRRLEAVAFEDIFVCSIVKAELFYGAMKSTNPERTLVRQQEFLNQYVSLSFDDQAALIYGQIRAFLAVSGTPIGPLDLQIAVIALANNLILVSHNTTSLAECKGCGLKTGRRSLPENIEKLADKFTAPRRSQTKYD